jgi:hypothetical protein
LTNRLKVALAQRVDLIDADRHATIRQGSISYAAFA